MQRVQSENLLKRSIDSIRTGVLNQSERKKLDSSTFDVTDIYPWDVIGKLPTQIENDIHILYLKGIISNNQLNFSASSIIGDRYKIYSFDDSIKIKPGVILDTTEGSILLGAHVLLEPFSILKGPLFIGNYSIICSARISGGTSIGQTCKISGEINNSILGYYSNKSHESALLSSYVGDWCNIAGYTNTTNLNINYSEVKVCYKNEFLNTNRIKFGAVISDFVRLGSGITIYPGAFIDYGSTILELPKIRGYYKPFTKYKRGKRFKLNEFTEQYGIIMSRRNKYISKELYEKWQKIIKNEC